MDGPRIALGPPKINQSGKLVQSSGKMVDTVRDALYHAAHAPAPRPKGAAPKKAGPILSGGQSDVVSKSERCVARIHSRFAPPQLLLRSTGMRLAIISEGIACWPLYAAQAQRLFERQGLEVAVTLTRSSARQLEALVRGDYDVGFQQSDHVVRAVERGADLFAFMASGHEPRLSLMAAPAVASIGALKGRTLAVDGTRSGYALLLRKLLARHGLRETDYTLAECGGSRERYQALREGRAAAAFLNPPFDEQLAAAGFRNLGTLAQFFPEYPGPVAAARRSWAREHASELVAFIRAFNDAFDWLHERSNRDAALRLLVERLQVEPRQAAVAYEQFVARPRPRLVPQSLLAVIETVWESEGLPGAPGTPEKYMDLSYFQKALA
jgi:ABC-type nitrate/sulfonate/bicarbonate transport system substrate-binding protein